ncbi:ferredoxin--NADP reductase [Nitratireductor sp. StC3]|uniref:ferredoxin--NADP reductase n=1 Tax=Nitratireductor sp. StC3 TaxID=2126741 RepID=UPI000D0DCAFF|nr:ferredoxin--NADP reductase [Nitratireductor sp. StC3]PSM19870.1 ferredoxin--NADP(+) reductase [Nitratireductor sp. StC3]
MTNVAANSNETARKPDFPIPAGVHAETVVSVKHYTDRLFSFRITRPQSFRFRSGEFVMIGLPNAEKPVFRAYSIASPAWDEELEFYSIKVPNGPLTSELQKIVPGDTVLLRQKSTGTLVNDALSPAKRLYMIASGTGIAPFASLIRDPDTYEKFDEIVLTNTCRDIAELAYGDELIAALRADPLIGELVAGRVHYYPTTTRADGARTGRITTLIESGKLFSDLGVAPFDPASDRVMICGSLDMIRDVKALVEKSGLVEGSNAAPADFVVERAFVG